jgi:cytochrome c-type biogenesis protein CcmF
MINTFIGNLGHFMTIVAFVSALVTAYAYIQYFKANEIEKASWKRFSRISFYIHGVSSVLIAFSLFEIIYNHRFEYFYAYSHSSKALPVHYMILQFLGGAGGSFHTLDLLERGFGSDFNQNQ